MRFLDDKDYPDPDNDAYYDIPANPCRKKRTSREMDDIHEGRGRMIRCPVKPCKWWNRDKDRAADAVD